MRDAKKFFCKVIFFVIVVVFSQNVFNRNPFLQLRERVRIEIGYFLELFLNLRPPPPGTFLVPKDFFSPFSGLQLGGEVSPIKYSIPKGRGGESGEMISILHRDVPASYYRVP